jgi:hypothetical protein
LGIGDPELRRSLGLPILPQPKPSPATTPEALMRRPLAPPGHKPRDLNIRKNQHKKFMAALEALSNEQPIILANFIMKYANSIQQSDPDTYKELLHIVNNIKV